MAFVKELHFDRWGLAFNWYSNDEEFPHNLLNVHVGLLNVYLVMPKLLKAKEVKVYPKWDEATIKRLGKDYYINYIPRQYGFSFFEGFLHTHYGVQTGSWIRDDPANSDHTKLFEYPWHWTHVRHSVYFTNGDYACNGDHFFEWEHGKNGRVIPPKQDTTKAEEIAAFCRAVPFEYPKQDIPKIGHVGRLTSYDNWSGVTTEQPIYEWAFYIDPFDYSKTFVRLHISEREWVRGAKWAHKLTKYLPFCRKVVRTIEIDFMDGVGSRKRSWKGGILGMGYTMLSGETLGAAWRRFCTDPEQIAYFKR